MPNFAHKQLVKRIAQLDVTPSNTDKYASWTEAVDHLTLLRENADDDELIIYASGEYTYVHTIVVSNDKLFPLNENDMLQWSICNPYEPIASYASGGGREGVWVERDMNSFRSKTLEDARQLVFVRDFEGWTGDNRTYVEILQEYAHLTGIHLRTEQRAYCKFDGHGDIDHTVSITHKTNGGNVSLVSFKRKPLEEYLAATDSSLIRTFDFTLLRRQNFSGWPDGPENIIKESDDFFYRQKIASGHAAYTCGVQIVRPVQSNREITSAIFDGWTGQGEKKYAEFIAYDWRNNCVTEISTDPTATTNYFETDGNSLPFELSPAFFRPEVLLKYKGDRDKYTIGPRDIHCRAAWFLKGYDVNEAGQVHAYICDLRMLPYSEQLHWKSHNEKPKASISERAFVNDFKGEFSLHTDPLQDVISIARRWDEKNFSWWKLRDKSLLERVSTPRTDSRDEWAEAFLDLAKLINEGFNVKGIRAKLAEAQTAFEDDDKSLVLMEKLLNSHNIADDFQKLEGLRTVQYIRTKAKGHSGGSTASKLAHDALNQHETFNAHFDHVCRIVTDDLERIERLLS